MHPKEARKGINTGRMAHLSMKQSYLVTGIDFSEDEGVQKLLEKHLGSTYLVFPGDGSLSTAECQKCYEGKHEDPLFIIIDGTWPQAKKMLNSNPWLQRLPKVCFHPQTPSEYKIRKQPNSQCYSTIECLQYLVSNLSSRHDSTDILAAFNHMVKQQVDYEHRNVPTLSS